MALYSLIVGIDVYKDAGRLYSCVNDALSWHELLRGRTESSESHLQCLSRVKDTTKSQILSEFVRMLRSMDDGDQGLFIFSGHGGRFEVMRNGEKRIMEGLRTTDGVIYQDEMAALLRANFNQNSRLVSIIDACNSGGFHFGASQDVEARPLQKPAISTTRGGRGLMETRYPLSPEHQNQALLLACQPVESAYGDLFDGEMRGVFTHYLIEILKKDPQISFKKFLDFLKTRLPDPDRGHFQTPQYVGTVENLNRKIIL